jgi:hypothetical protein
MQAQDEASRGTGSTSEILRLRGERMRRIYKTISECTFLVCLICMPARAPETQFLPEVDANLTLNSTFRAYLQAKDDREGGDPTQFAIGPSLQIYLKPLIKLKKG